MQTEEIADRLATLPVLASAPRNEIEWLIEHGELRHFSAGDVIRPAGIAVEEMDILISGRLSLYVRRGGGSRRIAEVGTGYVLGAIPYSRMQTSPGNLVVEADLTLLTLHQRHFPGLVSECPAITTSLVHQMIDRAREFRSLELHDERLLALGKLASGLAHELNNPASGASSGARALVSMLDRTEAAARALAAARLSDAQLEAVDSIRAKCVGTGAERSALEEADREDDFTDWLDRHGVDTSAAQALAASEVSIASLDALAESLSHEALGAAIDWASSGSAARAIALQIQAATARVHDLVDSVKGFTFMDRQGVPDDIDVAQGLAHTIAMLEGKARAKAVDIRVETADQLPPVYGYGSEINQVWEKLIDNAIDAVNREGIVTITATARGESVVIRIADNGHGIPDDIQTRLFDPFFTTKGVGQGTGLGLHNVRRIVHLHHGDIDFTSQPGRTVFRVRLPVTGAMAARAEPGSVAR